MAAFDPIKTSNLDGWMSYICVPFLCFFAFLLFPIYIWLHSAVADLQLSFTTWTEPKLQDGNVLTIGFVKFGLWFLHRLAQQTIRLRLCLCKSFSLLTWLMFYFKLKQQQTSFHRARAFEKYAIHHWHAWPFTWVPQTVWEWKMFSDSVITQAFIINAFCFQFDSNWFEAFA